MKHKSVLTALVAVVAVVLPVSVAMPATAAQQREASIQQVIAHKTGKAATRLTGSAKIGSLSITGRQETYSQPVPSGVRLLAALDEGTSAATFDFTLPAGAKLLPLADGSMKVVREDAKGIQVFASIDKPWALDANGKELATSYTVSGKTVTQNVDTRKAAFPVVADPSIQYGFYYVPVAYSTFTRAETLKMWDNVWWQVILTGLMCSKLGPVCVAVAGVYWHSIYSTLDYARANAHRCFKMRLPYAGPVAAFWTFKPYTVYC